MSDTLSDVLRAVRLDGAVFFAVDAASPWVAEAPRAAELAPRIMPRSDHVIEYHVVTSGSCYGGLVGEPAVALTAGDVIAFPQGDAHVMASAPGMRGDPGEIAFTKSPETQFPITVNKRGGSGERCEIICGFLGCDARPFNPLLASLPRVIHLRPENGDGVVAHFAKLALAESGARRAGGEVILARLSELLFVEMVRRHLSTLPPEDRGWLSGLRDEQVGRALGRLHDRPAHPWTLEELAREVGMSRSALAERFVQFVGVPPMQYLTQWRMQLAANLLAATAVGIAEVAARVGYGSEAALSRAFKRSVGVAPAAWRRQRGAVSQPTL